MNTISYWDKNTDLYSIYEKLYNELVPDFGPSDTIEGELIRSISNLFYEYCNNGNCNAKDKDVTDQYIYYLEFINTHCPDSRELIKQVKKLILKKGKYDFSQTELDVYNQLTDHVVMFLQSKLKLSKIEAIQAVRDALKEQGKATAYFADKTYQDGDKERSLYSAYRWLTKAANGIDNGVKPEGNVSDAALQALAYEAGLKVGKVEYWVISVKV